MKTKDEIWIILAPIVQELGMELFDIDLPSERGGTVRVYISKGKSGIIQVDDCALVSQRILDHPQIEEIVPGRCVLEVSSPGINRKLAMKEHFFGAIGERIKVKFKDTQGSKVIVGPLQSFDGAAMELKDETSGKICSVKFSDVSEARVDFLFS